MKCNGLSMQSFWFRMSQLILAPTFCLPSDLEDVSSAEGVKGRRHQTTNGLKTIILRREV